MDLVKVSGFDWDSGNLFKNETKHGLPQKAIETFFHGRVFISPDPSHSDKEERFLALGRDENGRPMIVAFTFRDKLGVKLIRPISARYMHAKETEKYEKAFTKNEK